MYRFVLATPTLLLFLIPAGCGKDPASSQDGESGSETHETGDSESACASHGDCGLGEQCQQDGCRPNWPGGPCDGDANCVAGEVCQAGTCAPDESATEETGMDCGGELYSADSVPPNVLIVLDRSGSMNSSLGNNQGTKWQVARSAIAQVVADYGDQVFFGLMLYPGFNQACNQGMNCGPGAVFIDPGPGTAQEITDFVNGANTCSYGTPTAETLEALLDYPGLEDLERPNYILLITDGQSSCANPVPVVTSLRDEDPEIKTFVVGFGNGVDPGELEDMAEAGGTALPGDPNYYQADDAQSLADAFADIAGSVLSCSYVLDQVPPDPNELYIYIDGMLIERDLTHTNGWDYDPLTNQVTFYGPACELLQSGQVTDLQIIFGCPGIG